MDVQGLWVSPHAHPPLCPQPFVFLPARASSSETAGWAGGRRKYKKGVKCGHCLDQSLTRSSAGLANSPDASRPSKGGRLRVLPLMTPPPLDFLGSSRRWKAPLPRCPLAAPNLARAPSLIGQGAAAMTWTRLTPTGWSSSTWSSRRWVGDLPGREWDRGRPGRAFF